MPKDEVIISKLFLPRGRLFKKNTDLYLYRRDRLFIAAYFWGQFNIQ